MDEIECLRKTYEDAADAADDAWWAWHMAVTAKGDQEFLERELTTWSNEPGSAFTSLQAAEQVDKLQRRTEAPQKEADDASKS